MTTLKSTFAAVFAAGMLTTAASAISLADLTHGYDVFVKVDVNTGARVHGSIAVGGDLSIESGNFAVNLEGNHGSSYSMLVDGQLNVNANGAEVLKNGGRGTIRVGSLKGGQTIDTSPADRVNFKEGGNTLSLYNEAQTQSDIVGTNTVDFASSFSALKSLSDSLSGLAATLNPVGPGDLEFDFGLSAGLHVINLTAAQLNAFGQTKQLGSLLSGARFLVNVDITGFGGVLGQNINQNVSDSFASGILWNFYGNSSLSIKTKWVGNILAPEVDLVDQYSNDIRGSVIAKTLTKLSGQIHEGSFDYEFPDEKVKVPDSGSTVVFALLAIPAFFVIRRRFN